VVLARELGIPFATIGLVTDYDCWKVGGAEHAVDVPTVMAAMSRLGEDAKKIIVEVVRRIRQNEELFREEIEKAQKMARDAVMAADDGEAEEIGTFLAGGNKK
jgi:hypothetical protein